MATPEDFKKQEAENLKKFEQEEKLISEETKVEDDVVDEKEKIEEPSKIDGFKKVNKDNMPYGGKLYPKFWDFYYQCPTTKDVANFSTIDPEDKTGIIKAVTKLITKYFTIVDNNTEKSVKSDQINDGERLYFFLLLREYYLNDAPIQYNIVDEDEEVLTINFVADSLVFPELKDGLIKLFDGRKFSFEYDENTDTPSKIEFLLPTLKTTTRIVKYMETLHKKVADTNKDGITKEEFDKQFMLFAPFLYEKGDESVMSLRKKFLTLQKDDIRYRKFNEIVNKLGPILTNKQTIRYEVDGNMGDCLMKFPGGWKNIFVDNKKFPDIF